MEEKNKALKEFYTEVFMEADHGDLLDYSSPHLISLDYKNVNTDIMIVGQETNSWYGSFSDFKARGVEKQQEIYSDFMTSNYKEKKNNFFKYARDIINNDSIVPVWTNLFKFDRGDNMDKTKRNISKAPEKERNGIVDFHKDNLILAKEIEIIKPKIIIFFTGSYDKLFIDPVIKKDGDYKELFKKIAELEKEEIDEWKCCHLDIANFKDFESFTGVAYRTYHPRYLQMKKNSFGEKIVNFLKKELKNY